jgi:hypothetical protein
VGWASHPHPPPRGHPGLPEPESTTRYERAEFVDVCYRLWQAEDDALVMTAGDLAAKIHRLDHDGAFSAARTAARDAPRSAP